MIRVSLSDEAVEDLQNGYEFYERQELGVGDYFLSQIEADIEVLKKAAGIHRQGDRGLYTMRSRKFPYSIFYLLSDKTAKVVAVIDQRRDPAWIQQRLQS